MKLFYPAFVVGACLAAVVLCVVPQKVGGSERWSVKCGVDPAARSVSLVPVQTTVETMRGFTRPLGLPVRPHGDDLARYAPVETTVYTLRATLTGCKMETDADYHLVIAGASGQTMIAEIPDPKAIRGTSAWGMQIAAARKAFDARMKHVGVKIRRVNVLVTVTGVGMFDFAHGQVGLAPNAIEIHPVLKIEFN